MRSVKNIYLLGIIALLFIAGCSSNSSNEDNESNTEDKDNSIKVADETALEYTRANYEYDIPVMFDLFTSEKQEKFKNEESGEYVFKYFSENDDESNLTHSIPLDELTNPEKFEEIKKEYDNADYQEEHDTYFQDFDKEVISEGKLYLVRFEDFFGDGEHGYYVKPSLKEVNDGGNLRRDGTMSSDYLHLLQENGEWKVEESNQKEFEEKGIDTENKDEIREKGEVIQDLEK